MTRFLAISALFALGLPGVAMADSIEVQYGDLNLAVASHQARLERRIQSAADAVCRIDIHPGSSFATPQQRECARIAAADAHTRMAAAIESAKSIRVASMDEAKR